MTDHSSYSHRDALELINQKLPVKEKLIHAHEVIQEAFPFIARISITIYDPDTKVLKTYLHSSGEDNPLEHYSSLLEHAPSLMEILKQGRPRVVNKLVTFESGNSEHTRRIGRQGYAASYTLPMFDNGVFLGFIFFNAYEQDVFTEKVLHELDLYGHLIALMIINAMSSIQTLTAAVKSTSFITHLRDPETGSHLDRMSRYSNLIAMILADKYDLDDEYIQHIFMFAPLHDLGKIAIPDNILLKPGALNHEEIQIMETHTTKGRKMVDDLIENFGLQSVQHVDMLCNIAEFHHEAVNGTGYPSGKQGGAIPLEARIVAVADVFDALTSQRPYKEAWSNAEAFAMLQKLAGEKLDHDCVNALIQNQDQVEAIQRRFREDIYG